MEFRAARDFLLSHRGDYETAYRDFAWPHPERFNWALDWFDTIAAGNDRPALWIIDDDGAESRLSFAELSARSDALAAWLRGQGVRRGDRTLLMLGNRIALWECILALTKLGAVMIPSTTLLTPADIADRIDARPRGPRHRRVRTDRPLCADQRHVHAHRCRRFG